MEATARQKRASAALIAKVAAPITFDEASRLIRGLRREAEAFPALLEQIVEADHAGDRDRLGRLLRRAQTRIRHGAWLATLRRLGIHPRRAQRLIAHAASPRHRKGKTMTDEMTGDEIASVNERAQALVDQLYDVLGEVCDGETSFLSVSQIVLARSGLDPQQVLGALTSLVQHNLCGDQPIRLAVVPVADETAPTRPTTH